MKKALSLLLAVLMLVSLFSGMAFADDDVIVEEPAAVDEIVGDDFAEAADAYVEEYTDEGSFEAADIIRVTTWEEYKAQELPQGWDIERIDPADPKCGDLVDVWVHDGEKTVAKPRTVLYDHIWKVNENTDADGWYLVSADEASCEEGGTSVYQRDCGRPGCKYSETKTVTLDRQDHVWATDPFTYAAWNGYDDDSYVPARHVAQPNNVDKYDKNATQYTPASMDAIKTMPDSTHAGVGHEVCLICGRPNPLTEDYVIAPHVHRSDDASFHLYSDWRVKIEPTCQLKGYEEKVCNVPGCRGSQNRIIEPLKHVDPETHESLMEFVGIERVSCVQYVEVWECSNPLCCTTIKNGQEASSAPKASQYREYRGKANNVWLTLEDAVKAAEESATYKTTYKEAVTAKKTAYDKAINDLKASAGDAAAVKEFNGKINDANKAFEKAVMDIKDDVFFWYKDFENEQHHVFDSKFAEVLKPGCCTPGMNTRICSECGLISAYPVEALSPVYGDEVFTTNERTPRGDKVDDYHYVTCTRPECVAKAKEVATADFLKPSLTKIEGLVPTDAKFYTQANNANPQTLIVDHDWSDWIVELAPQGENRGHWYRTCMILGCHGRQDFFGTQAEFDAMVNPPHPVLTTGIIKDEDGAFKLYEMGVFDKDFTGIYDGYNYVLEKSGKWYVVEGIWENDAMGATLVGSTWYFLANGKVQEVTQLAEYQGKWFYVVNGVIDTSKTALVDYNGGKFVVAKGRIVDEYSGLWQNAKSIGGDDSWYYVAKGQVQTQYTGLVQYDGEWFYVENGQLVPYNGEVEYDGEIFNVKEGMVVAA